jgi:hypothetical protein
VATDTPENLGRFEVLPRWKKAREGLFHGQSAAFIVLVVLTCLPVGAEPETISDQTARRLLDAVAERGYHDTSLLILDRLDEDQDLSEEFRRLIPLRRSASILIRRNGSRSTQRLGRRLIGFSRAVTIQG